MQAAPALAWHHGPARMRSSRSRAFTAVAEASLALLMVGAPLALGGAASWTLYPLAALALLAFFCVLAASRRQGHSLHLPLPSWVLALCCAVTAAQLVPLPPALLAWLSPPAAELREFALVPLGLTQWRPLSLDPPATWRELTKHAAYLATFLSVAQLARSRTVRRRLLLAVLASTSLVALIGAAHAVLNLHLLFGVHAFEAPPPFLTVFGNPNHAAAFMAVGSILALGLSFESKDRRQALPFWGASAGLGVAVVLTLSRGGILFLLAGFALFFLLLLRQRRFARAEQAAAQAPALAPAWVGVAALVVLALGAFVGFEHLAHELRLDSAGPERAKTALWPMLFRAGMEFAPAGTGRGAFESGVSRFQMQDPNLLYTHPENGVLQLLSELGLPVTAAVLALGLVWLMRMLKGRRNDPEELALLAAVLAAGLHDLFDFSLELPPTALALCFAVGVLDRPGPGASSQRWSLSPLRAAGGAVALAGLAALGLVFGRSTLLSSETALRDALASRVRGKALTAVVVREVALHPSDYLLYSLAGAGFSATDPLQSLAFLNRALFLRPLDVDSHRAAARALLRLNKRGQAFLEYGLAYNAMRSLRSTAPLMDEAVAAARSGEELRNLVDADDIDGTASIVARLQAAGRDGLASALLAEALEHNKADPRVDQLWFWEAHARYLRADFAAALEALSHAEQTDEGKLRVATLKAQVLARLGRTREAVEGLSLLAARKPSEVGVAFALAGQLLEEERPNQARSVLARARPFFTGDEHRRAAYAIEGASFLREGRHARALQAFQSALQLAPRDASLHFSLAESLEGLARFDEAIAEVRRGMELDPRPDTGRAAWLHRLAAQRGNARAE